MQQLKNALEEVGHCLAQFHFRLLVRLDVSVGWLSIDDLGVEKISCILWNVVGISQNFTTKITWNSLNQFLLQLPALIFKTPSWTNVGRRVIPQFSIAASKRVKTVEVSKRNRAILNVDIPLILEVTAMNNTGTSNHPTFTMKRGQMSWLSLMPQTQDFFFGCSHTKMQKCGGLPLCFGYLIDLLKKISVGWKFPKQTSSA